MNENSNRLWNMPTMVIDTLMEGIILSPHNTVNQTIVQSVVTEKNNNLNPLSTVVDPDLNECTNEVNRP